jgi:hypothetical protein
MIMPRSDGSTAAIGRLPDSTAGLFVARLEERRQRCPRGERSDLGSRDGRFVAAGFEEILGFRRKDMEYLAQLAG